ncbi:MAG: thiamine phosphate synthase [Verrucomicrobiota bacterium]
MALSISQRYPLMAITQHGGPLAQEEQVKKLCAAGVKWIQLRMKDAPYQQWLDTARIAAKICKDHGTIFIVNDNVQIALEVDANGVHLGRTDLEWREARRLIGPDKILGGTVNYIHEAEKAAKAGCMDYVGVGPLRFTRTKKELAPLQGYDGIRQLIQNLGSIPAWAIGGIEVSDVPLCRDLGAAGTAVCSALLRNDTVKENVAAFLKAWSV